jgi:hypothetical protein
VKALCRLWLIAVFEESALLKKMILKVDSEPKLAQSSGWRKRHQERAESPRARSEESHFWIEAAGTPNDCPKEGIKT